MLLLFFHKCGKIRHARWPSPINFGEPINPSCECGSIRSIYDLVFFHDARYSFSKARSSLSSLGLRLCSRIYKRVNHPVYRKSGAVDLGLMDFDPSLAAFLDFFIRHFSFFCGNRQGSLYLIPRNRIFGFVSSPLQILAPGILAFGNRPVAE